MVADSGFAQFEKWKKKSGLLQDFHDSNTITEKKKITIY
jgi:hypothetical protein